ncbi:GTP-binding protein [Chloroflexia bacterium SDU3-3]|nr:GTP-binding protein [Chloroflexia bacterium SDU3-3]
MNRTSPQPIPLTILTGFLGAGKTTLLNHILRGDHGLRIAVLVNDFGAINIDAELVENLGERTISLRNGCVCCSIRGDLLSSVLGLLQHDPLPEYLLLECSGVAEPMAVARTFFLPELRPFIQMESMVAVVDAEQVHSSDEQQDLIADQIAAADMVVLNKIDLASQNLLAGLREWIRMIVPNAKIFATSHAQVPLDLLLGVGRYQQLLDQPAAHDHASVFASWSFEVDRPFAFHALQRALSDLPDGVYRAKGVLWLNDQPKRRIVLQVVGRRVNLIPAEPWGDQAPRSRLALIGTPASVDPVQLQALFEAALVG